MNCMKPPLSYIEEYQFYNPIEKCYALAEVVETSNLDAFFDHQRGIGELWEKEFIEDYYRQYNYRSVWNDQVCLINITQCSNYWQLFNEKEKCDSGLVLFCSEIAPNKLKAYFVEMDKEKIHKFVLDNMDGVQLLEHCTSGFVLSVYLSNIKKYASIVLKEKYNDKDFLLNFQLNNYHNIFIFDSLEDLELIYNPTGYESDIDSY